MALRAETDTRGSPPSASANMADELTSERSRDRARAPYWFSVAPFPAAHFIAAEVSSVRSSPHGMDWKLCIGVVLIEGTEPVCAGPTLDDLESPTSTNSRSRGAVSFGSFRGTINELYLTDLKKKTHRGQMGQVLRGFSIGAKGYGYKSVPDGQTKLDKKGLRADGFKLVVIP